MWRPEEEQFKSNFPIGQRTRKPKESISGAGNTDSDNRRFQDLSI